MRKVTPEDNVDITDYVRHAGYTGEYMYNKITETINAFSDEDLKKACRYNLYRKQRKAFEMAGGI